MPTRMPTRTPTPTPGLDVVVDISSDWGTGFCTDVQVTNTTKATVLWETTYDVGGTITTIWNDTLTAGLRFSEPHCQASLARKVR